VLLVGLCAAPPAAPQDAARDWARDWAPTGSSYGGVGLIETRTARMRPDGALEAGVAYRRQRTFWFINFQALPFLETTFRFTERLDGRTGNRDSTDRSFDVKLRLLEESRYLPDFSIGLQDFVGTGIYSGEYIVASKRYATRDWGAFDFSLGMGWGRLGSSGMLTNPFALISDRARERPVDFGQGGSLNARYFRGEDAALFGGVEYAPFTSLPSDSLWRGLRLKLELNGDGLRDERPNGRGDAKSLVNAGIQWSPTPWVDSSLAFINGTDLVVRLSFVLDPTPAPRATGTPPAMAQRPPVLPEAPLFGTRAAETAAAPRIVVPAGVPLVIRETGPLTPVAPVLAAPPPAPTPAAPTMPDFTDPRVRQALAEAIATRLRAQGLRPARIDPGFPEATIVLARSPFRTLAQTAARALRAASGALPPATERVTVVMLENAVEIGRMTLLRRDLERADQGLSSAEEIALAAVVGSAGRPLPPQFVDFPWSPQFTWAIEPLLQLQLMDPDQPFGFNLLAAASGRVHLASGFSLGGAVGVPIIGNIASDRVSDSELTHVRSDVARYLDEGKVPLLTLTAERLWLAAPDLFARVTAGYLEPMYAGLATEVLYRPANAGWAVGMDVNALMQRQYDQGFGVLGYSVISGHASYYQDLGVLGLTGIVRAGRYLAGDWGATFEMVRKFASGIEVGGFATFTTVPFDRFGEGSFDKGIYIRFPFDIFPGQATRSTATAVLRPLTRDGGQRVLAENPLYGLTEPGRRNAFERDPGAVLR
jgi:hypothetical protein